MQTDRGKPDKGGFGSLRTPNSFSGMGIRGGGPGGDPIFGDMDSFTHKAKGLYSNKCLTCGNGNII